MAVPAIGVLVAAPAAQAAYIPCSKTYVELDEQWCAGQTDSGCPVGGASVCEQYWLVMDSRGYGQCSSFYKTAGPCGVAGCETSAPATSTPAAC